MQQFTPAMRFMVVSDVHYKDEPSVERERFAAAIRRAYALAKASAAHPTLDALFVVGDFADRGSEAQMQAFRETLDAEILPGTQVILSVASHEYNENNGGVKGANEKLARIFGTLPDRHEVIGGFHCISVSPSDGCRFRLEKQLWVKQELARAAADDPKKPIFFFQHPHITDTVYGSINWGEDDLTAILMNYPQIINFSGHSHAPINDPRSIHQQYFTSLGTGTLSYFELDEFDKVYGTVPPCAHDAAQMLLVEVDAENRVRIYPYDVLTDNPFPYVWKIDEPSNPASFVYTKARYQTAVKPAFPANADVQATGAAPTAVTLDFAQAQIEEDYVNDYWITIRNAGTGEIAKQLSIWSEYYFYHMPARLQIRVEDLLPGCDYTVSIRARGFWNNASDNTLDGAFSTPLLA